MGCVSTNMSSICSYVENAETVIEKKRRADQARGGWFMTIRFEEGRQFGQAGPKFKGAPPGGEAIRVPKPVRLSRPSKMSDFLGIEKRNPLQHRFAGHIAQIETPEILFPANRNFLKATSHQSKKSQTSVTRNADALFPLCLRMGGRRFG
jgi:hypothetical protein